MGERNEGADRKQGNSQTARRIPLLKDECPRHAVAACLNLGHSVSNVNTEIAGTGLYTSNPEAYSLLTADNGGAREAMGVRGRACHCSRARKMTTRPQTEPPTRSNL